MSNTANLKKDYLERIVPALQKEFNYSTVMQVPVLKKIVINQGLGEATADKKIIERPSPVRKQWLHSRAKIFRILNFVKKCLSA